MRMCKVRCTFSVESKVEIVKRSLGSVLHRRRQVIPQLIPVSLKALWVSAGPCLLKRLFEPRWVSLCCSVGREARN